MTSPPADEISATPHGGRALRPCWIAPGDQGGGVIWVADAACRAARKAGDRPVLLSLTPLSAPTLARIDYDVDTLDSSYETSRQDLLDWLARDDVDVVFFNDCHSLDDVIPHVPAHIRCVYVVHDTMSFYWAAALRHEASLDAVVAVSHETARRFRDRMAHPEKLTVIHNGASFVAPPPPGVERGQTLTFFGGDDPRKGADDLLAVWARLVVRGFRGELNWFGRLDEAFAARIARLPEAGRIHVMGHRPRQEALQALGRSAALILLSRAEACSMAVLEAMSMGAPVVAWDVRGTGIREIVPENARFLAPLGDFDRAADRTLEAIAASAAVGPLLIGLARERFSAERMGEDYRALVADVMRRPAPSRPGVGQPPPPYVAPVRASHRIPKGIWRRLRGLIAKHPRLYYFLRERM